MRRIEERRHIQKQGIFTFRQFPLPTNRDLTSYEFLLGWILQVSFGRVVVWMSQRSIQYYETNQFGQNLLPSINEDQPNGFSTSQSPIKIQAS